MFQNQLSQKRTSSGHSVRLAHSKTVLVVEDDPFVRVATCELLTNLRYRALEATNAAIALAVFEQNVGTIDLVLCDAILPDSRGIELCRLFQRQNAHLRFILTSGYPMSSQALDRGLSSCLLEKPYSGESLTSALEQAFATELHVRETLLPRPVPEEAQNLFG